MKKNFLLTLAIAFTFQNLQAQNTAPYWSLNGNSNATLASKLGTTNNTSLRIMTNNRERIKVLASGNVGIGTSLPSARLHVLGNGRFTNGIVVDSGGIAVSNAGGTALTAVGKEYGIYASHKTELGVAVYGYSTDGGTGVVGINNNYGTGVHGASKDAWGVFGYSETNTGIVGQSKTHVGIEGSTLYGYYGIIGESAEHVGVRGASGGYSGTGVEGSGFYGVAGYTPFPGGYAGYFAGNVYTTGSYLPSARKLKQNITDLNSALALIGKLQPKEYEYRHDGVYKEMNLPQGKRFGLIAEELEAVLPGLVKAAKFESGRFAAPVKPQRGVRPSPPTSQTIDFKAVNYTELIPIVIKGMQELSNENEDLKAANRRLEARLNKLEALLGNNATPLTNASLSQAIPNPVKNTARISYSVPAGSHAQLVVTDAAGKTIKVLSINRSGTTNLDTAGLSSGTYNYSLIVDGKQTDTKRLVVAR